MNVREAIQAYERGELILPQVLERAESAHAERSKGAIVLATLPGDVHDIGRAILLTVLSTCGYTVHDLGKQVPLQEIVDTALRLKPDAVGLSALLVTTSKQMPVCIQELDRRDVHIPVLVGGAAINRAFGRRSGILPDGRLYSPGVFYCKDVFEGLATMDQLVDPVRRAPLIEKVRTEIEDERDHVIDTPTARPNPCRRQLRHPARLSPPYWGARSSHPDLHDVWRRLDRNTLFRYHWGGYRLKGPEYDAMVQDVFEPLLTTLMEDAFRERWLDAQIVSGYFACNSSDDSLVLYEGQRELTRLEFPRQPDGERLCLADYFRPLESGARDVVGLQAVTVGPRAGRYVEELQRSGRYSRMLYVNGLASATTEALADYAHGLARCDLGIAADQGLRFSWGYGACPDLHEQHKVLRLLAAESQVGLRLTESDNLDPEHSTAAIIVQHPEVTYFSVR